MQKSNWKKQVFLNTTSLIITVLVGVWPLLLVALGDWAYYKDARSPAALLRLFMVPLGLASFIVFCWKIDEKQEAAQSLAEISLCIAIGCLIAFYWLHMFYVRFEWPGDWVRR
jgi:uncharacterized membrane protein